MDRDSLGKYEALSQADSMVDASIAFYRDLVERFPEWKRVLDGVIEDSIKTKGKIQALRDSITKGVRQLLDEGKEEGEKLLSGNIFVSQEVSDCFDEDDDETPVQRSLGGEEDVIHLLRLI